MLDKTFGEKQMAERSRKPGTSGALAKQNGKWLRYFNLFTITTNQKSNLLTRKLNGGKVHGPSCLAQLSDDNTLSELILLSSLERSCLMITEGESALSISALAEGESALSALEEGSGEPPLLHLRVSGDAKVVQR